MLSFCKILAGVQAGFGAPVLSIRAYNQVNACAQDYKAFDFIAN